MKRIVLAALAILTTGCGNDAVMMPREQHGLLSNRPQKVYRLPGGLGREEIGRLLFGEPDERYAACVDNDGNEYDLVGGRFVARDVTRVAAKAGALARHPLVAQKDEGT